MLTPIPSGVLRFFCGRIHRPPRRIRLMDFLGWHQELYYRRGEAVTRKRWVTAETPGRSIYTCRKRVDHWRVTVKPQGLRWVTMVHDRNFSAEGLAEANDRGIKNRKNPYWRKRIGKPTREITRVQIPTESWEIGHRYEFTRWEEWG